jgi:hypothetical protein
MILNFTMPGDVPSLKNSNGMNRRGQRFDNDEVKVYKRDFFYKLAKEFHCKYLGNKAGLLGCIIRIYHRDWRRDADVEIIYDCLQTAGVVLNDRWIRNKLVLGDLLDADNPRAEITLFTLGDSHENIALLDLAKQLLGAIRPMRSRAVDLSGWVPSPGKIEFVPAGSGPSPDGTLPTGKRPRQHRGVRRLPEGA